MIHIELITLDFVNVLFMKDALMINHNIFYTNIL